MASAVQIENYLINSKIKKTDMEYLRTTDEIKKFKKDKGIILSSPKADLYKAIKTYIEDKLQFSYIGCFDFVDGNKLCTAGLSDESVLHKNTFTVDSTVLDFFINKGIISDITEGKFIQIFAKSEKGIISDLFALNIGKAEEELFESPAMEEARYAPDYKEQ